LNTLDARRNDGKRWSTRDKLDLAAALCRGDTIEEAAKYLLRSGTVGEVGRMNGTTEQL
jgi:hypothetical protein